MELLKVHDLVIRRGETRILDGITWTVAQGRHWAVLGANGSGKTSLLNTLSGFFPPTSGRVEVLGRVYGESLWSELREVIGVVNHTVADWIRPDETALEIVVGGLHAQINYWGRVTKKDRETAMDILNEYDLAYAADRSWLQLSQGERQRTLICRALMADYRMLILDEPCVGLDPVARQSFLRFIETLTSSRAPNAPALLLVTHHVEEITPAFTHVLVMKEGKVAAAGPKPKILRSEVLSDAFGAEVIVRHRKGRYGLDVLTP